MPHAPLAAPDDSTIHGHDPSVEVSHHAASGIVRPGLDGYSPLNAPHKSQKWIYKIKTVLIEQFIVSNLMFNVSQIRLVDRLTYLRYV